MGTALEGWLGCSPHVLEKHEEATDVFVRDRREDTEDAEVLLEVREAAVESRAKKSWVVKTVPSEASCDNVR